MEIADNEGDEDQTKWKTVKESVLRCTPELIIALLNVSVTISTVSALPQILKATCYHEYGPRSSPCSVLRIKETSESHHLQSSAALYTSIFRVLISIPPLFTGLYCGTCSDRIGKKLPILLTITGIVLSQLIFIHSDFFRDEALVLIISGALLMGISGNVETVGVCLLAYTSNHTTVKLRTFKIGLLTGSSFFGKFIGAILVGSILQWSSFPEAHMVAIIISSASFFICLICLHEVDTSDDTMASTETRLLISKRSETTMCSPFTDIYEFISKKRGLETYVYIICVIVVSFLGTMSYTGAWDMLNLIIKRPELALNDAMYGFIRGVGAASNALALLIFQGIMSQLCGISDIAICITGSLACVFRYSMLVVTDDMWAIWTNSAVQGLGVMLISASISLASKQVAPEEQGKLMALLQAPQFLGNAIGSLVYASIYSATFHSFPRLVFLVAASTHVLLLLMFATILIWRLAKR